MYKAWIQWGGTAAACLALLLGSPLKAEDSGGVRVVAEELGERTKEPGAVAGEQQGKLSDSAVRVMSTLAWSIMPEEYTGPDGKKIKLDKKNPNKYFIPFEDARRIIRAATRSAYAEACELVDLERANYEALMNGEKARNVWSQDQILFITALHMFSVSYFAGNMKITAKEEDQGVRPAETAADKDAKKKAGEAATEDEAVPEAQGSDQAAETAGTQVIAPKKLTCSPEQKEKVTAAINAYVQSAKTAQPAPAKPAPVAPVAGGAN